VPHARQRTRLAVSQLSRPKVCVCVCVCACVCVMETSLLEGMKATRRCLARTTDSSLLPFSSFSPSFSSSVHFHFLCVTNIIRQVLIIKGKEGWKRTTRRERGREFEGREMKGWRGLEKQRRGERGGETNREVKIQAVSGVKILAFNSAPNPEGVKSH